MYVMGLMVVSFKAVILINSNPYLYNATFSHHGTSQLGPWTDVLVFFGKKKDQVVHSLLAQESSSGTGEVFQPCLF